ncbi:MAG: hypothetical protein WBV33_06625 [Terracidiphilus sp.]
MGLPLLNDYLAAAKGGQLSDGLTEKQIEDGFRKLATQYIHSDFHSTYIVRRLGRAGFVDYADGKYRLRPSLLEDTTLDELDKL